MKKNSTANLKIISVGFLFFTAFCAIVFRLYSLQIDQHATLLSRSNKQYKRMVRVKKERGVIYDRDLNILAASIRTDSLFVNPQEIEEKKRTIAVLAEILELDKSKVARKIQSKKHFQWIKRKLEPAIVKEIKEQKLKGVGFLKEYKRIYPDRDMAGNIIGFTGTDDSGLAGLESKYNRFIEGKEEIVLIEKDAKGRHINYANKWLNTNNGYDLITTIDHTTQYIAERELKKQIKKVKAKSGIVIVMETSTGELLAMANYPTFNPNNYNDYNKFSRVNRAVTYSYEPGSTFKLILAAAALEEGILNPDDIFYCGKGEIEVGGIVIHDSHKFEWMTMKRIIGKSSNIGAVQIGMKLNKDIFYQYIKKFGFGKKTAIGLPGESVGILHPLKRWTGSSIGAISIGHEVAVTPIQLVTAFATVANGGRRMKPHIVRALRKGKKTIKRFYPEMVEQVLSENTSKKVTDMLEYVVTDGTGVLAAVEGYSVAGKTGTAQKIDPLTKKYSKEKFVASFVGYLPAKNPKVTILVMIDEPTENIYGGKVAAPLFSTIAGQVMRHMRIPHDTDDQWAKERMAQL